MRTLHRLPRGRDFQRLRSSWIDDTFARDRVAIEHEKWRPELYALELPKAAQEERQQERLRRWARVPPNAAEAARMDEAIFWSGSFLEEQERSFLNL